MKIINYATYIDDLRVVARIRPIHRRYMDELIAAGTLDRWRPAGRRNRGAVHLRGRIDAGGPRRRRG